MKVGENLLKPSITEKFPYGFLGKVKEIKGTSIVTEKIGLTEAFKELTIHFGTDITTRAAPVKDTDYHQNGSFNFSAGFNGTLINKDRDKSFASTQGSVSIGGRLLVYIVINNHKYEYQRYGVKIDASIASSIVAKFEKDNGHVGQIKIYSQPLGAIAIGPVVIVPEHAIYFGMKVEGSVSLEGKLEYSVPMTVGCEKYGNGEWVKLESDKSTLDDNLFKINGKISGLLGAGIIYDFRAMVYDVFGPDVKGEGLLAFKAEFECNAQKALSGELYDAFQDSKGELLFILGGGVGVVSQIPFTNLEWYWDNKWDKEFSIAKWPLLPDFKQLEAKQNNSNTMEIKNDYP